MKGDCRPRTAPSGRASATSEAVRGTRRSPGLIVPDRLMPSIFIDVPKLIDADRCNKLEKVDSQVEERWRSRPGYNADRSDQCGLST